MKRENWFPTPVWHDYTEFDFDLVKSKCLQLREMGYPNVVASNYGGWQSIDLNANNKLDNEFLLVKEIINEKIIDLCQEINSYGSNLKLQLANVWVNINKKNDGNNIHVHPLSAFSGTLYVSVNANSGSIRFYNQYSPMNHYPLVVSNSPIFSNQIAYTPKNGMIIFFPSWVAHDVEFNSSEEDRISISFNIRQVFN